MKIFEIPTGELVQTFKGHEVRNIKKKMKNTNNKHCKLGLCKMCKRKPKIT